jgi:lipoyl(octanoyl) transferase
MHELTWKTSEGLTPYLDAVAAMEAHVLDIALGRAGELLWLVEHPPLYTAGTSAKAKDLLDATRFPVHKTGRGGEFTYHGPGQRVVYVMLDLKKRGADIRAFVCQLEAWIIATLANFDVVGERRPGRVGVWVNRGQGREDKIAALGVRVRKWVSFHGIAINVNPDLSHYSGIVPCGIAEHGVTSLADLGHNVSMPEVDAALRRNFDKIFKKPD